MPSSRRANIAIVAAIMSIASIARGSPAEVFGFGSASAGQGGAVAASVVDFSSGFYNPAGLAFGRGKTVSFGFLAAASNLQIDGRDRTAISEPIGMVFGATSPAPLGGPLKDRLHVGVGLYLLPTTVVQVIARQPDEPFFPYYDNRTQRLVVLPVIAARVHDDVSVGVGLNILAGLSGQVLATPGPTRAIEARVDEEIFTTVKFNAGVRWHLPLMDVALVYRQEFSVPFTTVTNNEVAGEPIDLDIHADGLYTPHEFTIGSAFHLGRFEATLDVTWSLWSAYDGPYVQVDSELPLVGGLRGNLPVVPYDDTIAVRSGLLVPITVSSNGTRIDLRGGVGFETSPVPADQPGVTNQIDGAKLTFSAGAGLIIPRRKGAVKIYLHAQAQLVKDREIEKTIELGDDAPPPFEALRDEDPDTDGVQISNPGYPSIRGGGQVFSGGLTVEVEL